MLHNNRDDRGLWVISARRSGDQDREPDLIATLTRGSQQIIATRIEPLAAEKTSLWPPGQGRHWCILLLWILLIRGENVTATSNLSG